jgi:hypothetical protein
MNARAQVLLGVAVQIVAGVVLAVLLDKDSWANVREFVDVYVWKANATVIAAVAGSTWMDKYTAAKTNVAPGGQPTGPTS